jgi:hypothetical protein
MAYLNMVLDERDGRCHVGVHCPHLHPLSNIPADLGKVAVLAPTLTAGKFFWEIIVGRSHMMTKSLPSYLPLEGTVYLLKKGYEGFGKQLETTQTNN